MLGRLVACSCLIDSKRLEMRDIRIAREVGMRYSATYSPMRLRISDPERHGRCRGN